MKSTSTWYWLALGLFGLTISGAVSRSAYGQQGTEPVGSAAGETTLVARADSTLISPPAAAPATAANLPKTPAPPPADSFNWRGFYVGANIGNNWGTAETSVNPLPSAATFVNLLPQTLSQSPGGILFGGHAGYNWQFDNMVVGAEFDMGGFGSGMNVTKTVSPITQNNNTPFPGVGNNITVSHDTSWYGTVRPRMGIAHRNVLVYGTVGMAFAHVSGAANTDFRPVGTEQYPAAFDETRIGWTAGGGVEVGFRKHWIVRGEFLLYDVDASPIKASPVPPLPPFGIEYGFINRVNVARFGMSYKF